MANEFLPHATGGGSNVITQSAWNALAARLTGFQAGVAKSSEVNKAIRQGTSVAAMIGQFISDHSAQDALDDGDIAELLERFESAVRRGDLNYAVAGGSGNTLTVTLDPVPISAQISAGFTLRVLIATGNTGAATLNPNGLGATAITRPNGAALRQGDLVPGQIATFVYTGTGWMLESPGAADAPVGGTTVITATGTANFIVPANVFRLREVIVIAAGGGGGGGQNATTFSGCGGGGGAGGLAIKYDIAVTPGQVISTTVGAGGTAGTPALNGGTGDSSSFGAVCSATGGAGGLTASGSAVNGGIGSGGDINIRGGDGGTGVISSGPQPKGGDGTNGPLGYGGGGSGSASATSGLNATGYGAGAGGGGQNLGGGIGSPGLIIVRY